MISWTPAVSEVDAPSDDRHSKANHADGKAEGTKDADGQPSVFLQGKYRIGKVKPFW